MFQCLGHLNWTMCSHLSPFCPRDFSTFSFSYWEANSYYPRGLIMGKGNSHNPKSEWDSGFSVLWTFILDHLHHFKPILFWKFSNFFTFILGSRFGGQTEYILPKCRIGSSIVQNPIFCGFVVLWHNAEQFYSVLKLYDKSSIVQNEICSMPNLCA